MNKQVKLNKDGTIKSRGIEWTDYTSNPAGGCLHGCQWTMPDGTIANCYAEDVAEGIASAAYPQGFEHYYWNPKEMTKWKSLKPGSKVFVGSMADNFGHWVPDEHIQMMLDACREVPEVTFQLLTKNPSKATQFEFPPNVWLGASTPPNRMWNKDLNRNQRDRMFEHTLRALDDIRNAGTTVWLSAEPLTIDAGHALQQHMVDWVVIGAASNGNTYYPPDEIWVKHLVLWAGLNSVPVFFKGNLRILGWAKDNWREEFPT